MSKKEKIERGEIGPDHPFFNRLKDMVVTLSDNEKVDEKVAKFFGWYEEIFKKHLVAFNDACGEVNELIDEFEKEIKSRKEAGDTGDATAEVNKFQMSLLSLHEQYTSHMKITTPFINMCFRYSFEDKKVPKFFKDIGTVLEGTNKRVEYWEKKLDK